GWDDDGRGLRGGLARALAGARCGRSDRPRLSARSVLARHGSPAGAALGFRALCRPPTEGGNGGGGRRPPEISRSAAGRGGGGRARSPQRCRTRRSNRDCAADRGHGRGQARRHRCADCRIAQARQGGAMRGTATAGGGRRRASRKPYVILDPRAPVVRSSIEVWPAHTARSPRRGSERRRMTDGRQRQPARIVANRRRGRPRESDRPQHRHRRHGGCDPEGGTLALWQRDRSPRRDQSKDRRDATVASAAGGGSGRKRRDADRARRRAKSPPPARQVGDYIAEALPPLEYGRIAAQSAKQVIVQKVREAERDRQYQEYKDRISDIVNGIVKRVEYGNVVVDLGRGEAI